MWIFVIEEFHKVLFGYNFTSPNHMELVNKLRDSQCIDYVELMGDNFLSVNSSELRKLRMPVSIHIMYSKFLERNPNELEIISTQLRALCSKIDPLYFSDHILQFSHNNNILPYLQEINYENAIKNFSQIEKKITYWCNLIGQPVLFENAASLDSRGRLQDKFMLKVNSVKNAGILLDLTNLFISIKNGGTLLKNWIALIKSSKVFHIGSYVHSKVDSSFLIDSHNSNITKDFILFLDKIKSDVAFGSDVMITFERDFYEEAENLKLEFSKIREVLL